MSDSRTSRRSAWLHRFVADFPWVHMLIAVLGSAAFLVGSLFLLNDSKQTAIWLFIAGSSGMLVGNVGQLVARYELRKHAEFRER